MTGPTRLPPSPPQELTMARLGNLRWMELRAFEILGSWVNSTPEPDIAVAFAAASRHAAARASVLAGRLPREGHLRLAVVTQPRTDELAGVLDALSGQTETTARVGVAQALLAAIAEALDGLVPTLSPVADGPSLRALPLVRADLDVDRSALEMLAGGAPGTRAVDEAADQLARAGGC
jgi:O-succinylbenzoate synthase